MAVFFRLIGILAFTLVTATSVTAQSRFSPVIQVGDDVITRYQLDQRTRFLSLLRAPGDPRNLAREQLINEAIQQNAATAAEISVTPEMIEGGMTEFAARANLTADEFRQALGQNGVDAETFRDFVAAGVAWREYSRAQFADQARDIPRTEINRTLAQTGTEGGLRVLVSEILLPTTTPETARISRERAAELSQITTEAEFATAARQFSVSASRGRGGELNWVALDSLPEEIRSTVAALTPGQVSRPIELENAVGLFFLRDAERAAARASDTLLVDYALFIADSPSDAARISGRIDVCDDLYGVAKGLAPERLTRESETLTALPADVRGALNTLDLNETAILPRGDQAAVVMLCSRTASLESEVDFELVANRLLNTRLTSIAADHLADLRANTYVADLTN